MVYLLGLNSGGGGGLWLQIQLLSFNSYWHWLYMINWTSMWFQLVYCKEKYSSLVSCGNQNVHHSPPPLFFKSKMGMIYCLYAISYDEYNNEIMLTWHVKQSINQLNHQKEKNTHKKLKFWFCYLVNIALFQLKSHLLCHVRVNWFSRERSLTCLVLMVEWLHCDLCYVLLM